MNLPADTLEIFLQKMPMGIAIFNTDLTLRRCNAIWARAIHTVTKRPFAQIIPALPLTDLLPPAIVDLSTCTTAALTGKTVTKEAVPLRPDDATYYWDVFFSSLRENKVVNGLLFIITDVTKTQTAERALLTLMDNLPGMAYRASLDAARQMELVSDGALELTGYSRQQFTTRRKTAVSYADLIHPEDREAAWLELQTAVKNKRPFALHYRIHTANNAIRWVQEQGSGLFSPDGDLLAIEGFISDVTDQELSKQILERRVVDRTQKLSALYEMTAVAVKEDDLKISLKQALTWALTAVRAQTGAVQLLDNEAANLHLAVRHALPAEIAAALTGAVAADSFWGRGLQTGRPVVLGAAALQAQIPARSPQTTFRAYAGLPIAVRGHQLGVLHIWRRSKRPFSESDAALLAAAAGQMGTTIENARLHRENERLLLLDERNRLARELHDAVTQSLYSLTLFAETSRRFAAVNNLEQVTLYSRRIEETAAQSLKEMRLLLHNLRPSILQTAGLNDALRHRLDAVEKRAGIQARLICDHETALPPSVEETLFHIAEEALNNALKHGSATAVSVIIAGSDSHVTLTVQDNGSGFDEAHLQDSGGLGLNNMRERAALLDGVLTIQSTTEGTAVIVDVDLDALQAATASRTLLDLL